MDGANIRYAHYSYLVTYLTCQMANINKLDHRNFDIISFLSEKGRKDSFFFSLSPKELTFFFFIFADSVFFQHKLFLARAALNSVWPGSLSFFFLSLMKQNPPSTLEYTQLSVTALTSLQYKNCKEEIQNRQAITFHVKSKQTYLTSK